MEPEYQIPEVVWSEGRDVFLSRSLTIISTDNQASVVWEVAGQAIGSRLEVAFMSC